LSSDDMLLAAGVLTCLLLVAYVAILSYAVPRYRFVRGLTGEQKRLLSAAGIRLRDEVLDGESGTAIFFKDVGRMLDILNAWLLTTLETTGWMPELVLRPQFEEEPSLAGYEVRNYARVTETGFPAVNAKFVRLLRETVLPAVRRNINVHDMGGLVHAVEDSDDFDVYIWSTAKQGGRDVAMPDRLFGLPARATHSYAHLAKGPSGEGVHLVDPASGFTYGEVCGRSLYLFAPVLPRTPEILILLARMLDHACPELNLDGPVEAVLAQIPQDGIESQGEEHAVTVHAFAGVRRERLHKLVQGIVAPAVREDVCVVLGDGGQTGLIRETPFKIFYNARPPWLPADATLPTGVGVPLSTENCALVGEYFPEACYIYRDVLGAGSRAEVARLGEVLLTLRRQIMLAGAGNARQLIADEFLRECLVLTTAAGASDAVAAQALSEETEKRLHDTVRAARKREQEITRLFACPEDQLGLEFDSLLRIKKVKDVQVTETELVVETGTLYCADPRTGRLHEIGKFRIQIPFEQPEWMRFLNLTRTVSGRHAPHVGATGIPCLGTTKDQFPQLIREREFTSVVNLAILFLESVNVNDAWGRYIDEYPVAAMTDAATDRLTHVGRSSPTDTATDNFADAHRVTRNAAFPRRIP